MKQHFTYTFSKILEMFLLTYPTWLLGPTYTFINIWEKFLPTYMVISAKRLLGTSEYFCRTTIFSMLRIVKLHLFYCHFQKSREIYNYFG